MINLPYKNVSGLDIPAHAVVNYFGDSAIAPGNNLICISATFPTAGSSVFGIDNGKGCGASGPTAYGLLIDPISQPCWVYYTRETAPGTAWTTEVGPISGQWQMDVGGFGYLYAGVFDPANQRIQVIRKAASGGGTCNTVRFRVAAPIANTMSAICFIHAVDAGFTLEDVPDLANLEFPGNPLPGTPNIIVCDPNCSYFNEPQAGLTNRYGWAKYMQPLVPNACQPNAAYLSPQWEVFALNCVMNPQC